MRQGSTAAALVTREVTRAPELTAAIPAASVMIPEAADGQFELLLEPASIPDSHRAHECTLIGGRLFTPPRAAFKEGWSGAVHG
ncbi:hypothetical protein [Prosthecobacter debontii]|uniref:hypothetical protein n=1 Tax=Prosthecobacter debontii TaxID=48467 RepID=UPI0009991471|nr:hypothetical protein [Prosthecobacter debontii]